MKRLALASSDTFDKVDLRQLRVNAAIAAAVTLAYADSDTRLPRHSRADIEALIKSSDLADQMKAMGVWDGCRVRHARMPPEVLP